MKSEPSRTFIGSVLCVDLVGYSKRTVDEQITVKSAFNSVLSTVIKHVRADDRIILDTGDGAAVSFLGDPDECLKVGLELRDRLMEAGERLGVRSGEGPVRIGMHMGPLRVALDMNGHPNIIGDGLVAAERVMGFAQPGQIVASRGFHEMVSRLSAENTAMFRYEGKHTDKNAREHEIYIVEDRRRVRRAAAAKTAARKAQAETSAGVESALEQDPEPAPEPPPPPAKSPEATRPQPAPRPKPAAPLAPAAAAMTAAPASSEGALARSLRNPVMVWGAGIVLMAVIFTEAWLLDRKHAGSEQSVAESNAPRKPSPAAEPPAMETKPAVVAAKPAPAETKPASTPPQAKPTPPEAKPATAEAKPAPSEKAIDAKPAPVETKAAAGDAKPPTAPTAPTRGDPAPPPKVEVAAKADRPKADAAPQKAERPKSESTKSERAKAEEARVAAAKSAPPPVIPQPDPAPPPPPVQAPPPAPVQLATTATPVSRATVQFPRAAAQQGIESGTVRARLAINAEGRVTGVTVLGSSSRLFDREAVRALEEWRFNPGAPQRSYEVEVEFRR